MDLYQKISILGPSAQYDTCGPKDFGKTTDIPGIYHAKVGGKNVCRLFKVLQTNYCVNDCSYCAFRRDRSVPRVTATSGEMAQAFNSAYSRRLVDGLFLSSGIDLSPDSTMTRLLDTAHILRDKFDYKGYIHLKIMPGVSADIIEESVKLADRISVNIESPTEEDLLQLSRSKKLKSGVFYALSQIRSQLVKRRLAGISKVPSVTTQFVVGAGKEKDSDIVNMTNFLYRNFKLSRVFYSAFRPVERTPLEDKPAASLVREHRLYQADFLMRFYRFLPSDIPMDDRGFLSEVDDPKMIWAKSHPEFFPININNANYWKLLKVPGIGPVTARKIVNIRKNGKIGFISQLNGMRVQINKLRPFVSL